MPHDRTDCWSDQAPKHLHGPSRRHATSRRSYALASSPQFRGPGECQKRSPPALASWDVAAAKIDFTVTFHFSFTCIGTSLFWGGDASSTFPDTGARQQAEQPFSDSRWARKYVDDDE